MTVTPAPDARQLRPYPYLEHPLSVEDIDARRGALSAEWRAKKAATAVDAQKTASP